MLRFDLDPNLIGAGQPSPADLKELQQQGVKTVINIRAHGEMNHPPDMKEQVEELGMAYIHMPVAGLPAISVDNARNLATLIDESEGPVVVHCGSSNRVGALLALKAKHIDGKSTEEALAYGRNAGMTDLTPYVVQLLDG